MKLIIVESPKKSRTIGKFLGKDYQVMASEGHVRDLASRGPMGLGVDVNNGFKPTYEIIKSRAPIVKELKAAAKKADEVLLATDPDREGEAISWHLANVLGLPIETTKRLEFHEITKPAILKALANPRTINMNLVESQETRRIIDRLMGYRLSHLLQKKIKSRAAGRVQSVVLKFIVQREKEIDEFVPVEYWTVKGDFSKGNVTFSAALSQYLGKPINIPNENEADRVLSELPETFKVSAVKTSMVKREPNPPFITATLQQAAFSQLHFSTSRTQAIAQHLYEGEDIDGQTTGLITYMRTDSTRLSDEFVQAANQYIQQNYGDKYLGHIHMQKASKNIQDAHEAIRPTNIDLTPSKVKPYLSNDEYKLYSMIYDRALASLMSARQDEVKTMVISGNGYDFMVSSSKNVFDGYHKVYGEYETKDESKALPDWKEGDDVKKEKIEKEQHFTKAPARYNEGKVVKLMQENGIGRPSTYNSTITTLRKHDYIENVKNQKGGALEPTDQAVITVDELQKNFPKYMDVSYTAGMENDLDSIAEGKLDKTTLLTQFWDEFQKYYDSAEKNMEKVQPKVVEGKVCPKCGSPLVYRHSKYGEFIGCSNYPKCKYVEKEKSEVIEGRVCPKCGKPLVKRQGKRGLFIGCSGYPSCNYMESMDGKPLVIEKKEVVIPKDAPLCPRCHTGHLIEKTSRWGKKFIGCSNYPKCKYIVKDNKTDDDKK